jgi:hypothetical protein
MMISELKEIKENCSDKRWSQKIVLQQIPKSSENKVFLNTTWIWKKVKITAP